MDSCSVCNLSLPRIYTCEHCKADYCFTDLVKHSKEVNLTYIQIPAQVKEADKQRP